MTYLSNVASDRPMLRISATIILAFTCAAPFVLLFSGMVGYACARSFIESKSSRQTVVRPGALNFLLQALHGFSFLRSGHTGALSHRFSLR